MKQKNKNSDYYIFDVDGFFRDYKKNKRRLRDLEWDYAQLLSNGGMDYSKPKVDSSPTSSTVEQIAMKRGALEAQIADLREFLTRADKYINALEPTEKAIAEVYFVQGRKGVFAIQELSEKLGYSKTPIYKMIGNIRRKIRQFVENE